MIKSFIFLFQFAFYITFLSADLIPHLTAGQPGFESNTDAMLNELFRKYDRHQPPMSPASTVVQIGIYINSFYSISEQTMEYSLNIYLRQSWRDPRLAFNNSKVYGGKSKIQLSADWVALVWRPDIFFRNEKKANFHLVTIPNLLFRLHSNGDIWYVTKISATLSCMMNLRKYPLDTQSCPMMLESFGHTADDVNFQWMNKSVEFEKKMQMPQFELLSWSCSDCTQNYTTGTYPCLQADFFLKRDFGYFLSQLYVPTVLIVILSWVGFWINIDAIPARVSLGLLTVLTMTTQSSGARSQLPRVSYIKAIDVWTSVCLLFVFVSLLEFAVVNVMSRKRSQLVKKKLTNLSSHAMTSRNFFSALQPQSRKQFMPNSSSNEAVLWSESGSLPKSNKNNSSIVEDLNENKKNEYSWTADSMFSTDKGGDKKNLLNDETPRSYMNYKLPKNSSKQDLIIDYKERARRIDKISRYIFPLCFLIFNFVYWIYYTQVPLD